MRKLFLVLALLASSSAWAVDAHDCRILPKLRISFANRADGIHLTARYIGYDGAILYQPKCPDEIPPTWGSDGDGLVGFQDALGFEIIFQPSDGLHFYTTETSQGWLDPQFKLGQICLEVTSGRGRAVACPESLVPGNIVRSRRIK
jgi:hypothetical protein